MTRWTDPWFETWQSLLNSTPWQSALDSWWRRFSNDGAASAESPVFEKIAGQSRSFFHLGEELAKAFDGDTAEDPAAAMDRCFAALKQALEGASAAPEQGLLWQAPMAQWERTVSSVTGTGAERAQGGDGAEGADPLSVWQRLARPPGLGPMREWQAASEKLDRLRREYLEAHRDYASLQVDTARASVEAMQRRLADRAAAGEAPLKTVREFYDLWVECSETVHRSRVLSSDYPKAQGRLVNALMALKRQGAQMIDDASEAAGLPSRREIDTIQHRLQEERRTVRGLSGRVETLSHRVAEMGERTRSRPPAKRGGAARGRKAADKASAGAKKRSKGAKAKSGKATGSKRGSK